MHRFTTNQLIFAWYICIISRIIYTMSDHPQDGGQNASATPLASSRLVPASTQGSYDPFEIIPMITELYEMYSKMRYIPASNIKYPPHSPPVDVEKARSLGFEPQVIELLERLPYVQGTDSEFEFFCGGGFLDNRGDHDFEHYLHDPFYADPEGGFDDENGQYVRPWVLPLNDMGNHGSVMFFDTRTGKLLISDYLAEARVIRTHATFWNMADR